jgi:hypothetical protein
MKIYVDGKEIFLSGQDEIDVLNSIESELSEEQAALQAEQDAKAAAKESALTKLQALGLSEAEAKQIVGA